MMHVISREINGYTYSTIIDTSQAFFDAGEGLYGTYGSYWIFDDEVLGTALIIFNDNYDIVYAEKIPDSLPVDKCCDDYVRDRIKELKRILGGSSTVIVHNSIFTISSKRVRYIDNGGVENWKDHMIIANHSDSDICFTIFQKESNITADINVTIKTREETQFVFSPFTEIMLDAFKKGYYSFEGDDLNVAKEIPSELTDFKSYFDYDGFKSAGGENCSLYIFHGTNSKDIQYNKEEFSELYKKAEILADNIKILLKSEEPLPYDDSIKSIKHLMELNGIHYTSEKEKILRVWAESFDTIDDTVSISTYLTVATGKQWKTRSFTGYTQDSSCTVLYCTDIYTDDSITEIGKLWLGCGAEYSINDERGYFIIDDIQWKGDEEIRQTLADYYGCEPRNLIVQRHIDTVSEYVYQNS